MNGLGATCGYFFMGSAANAQRRAELAGAESRALLAELQTAHRQLQANASRAEELACGAGAQSHGAGNATIHLDIV